MEQTRIRAGVIGGILCAILIWVAPAARAQQVEPSTGDAGTGSVAPGPFAADETIEERLREIVDLAKRASEDHHRYDLTTLTCGEFLTLSASESPDDYAVMAMLMVWTHGYHSGLRGLNFHAYPLDTEGIVSLTSQMVSICKARPRELFHVAAARLD